MQPTKELRSEYRMMLSRLSPRSYMRDFFRPIREMQGDPKHAAYLSQIAGAAAREGASHDEVSVILRQLKEHFARGDASLLEQINERLESRVLLMEGAARSRQLAIEEPVLVAIYPIGGINATARKIAGGYLLLVNAGLATFLHQFCQLLAAVSEVIEPAAPVDLDDARQKSLIGEWLAAYYRDGYSGLAPPPPFSGPRRRAVGAMLRAQVESFVLAHEYAHVVAGHLDGQFRRKMATLVSPAWAQELEADMLAILLTFLASGQAVQDANITGDEDALVVTQQCLTAAPFVFFELASILTELHMKVGMAVAGQESTHPPSDLRAKLAYEHIADLVEVESVASLAASCLTYFTGTGREGVERAVLALRPDS